MYKKCYGNSRLTTEISTHIKNVGYLHIWQNILMTNLMFMGPCIVIIF